MRIITKNEVAHEKELLTQYNDKWKRKKNTIREYKSNLRDVSGKDPTLQKARKMAEWYFNNNVDIDVILAPLMILLDHLVYLFWSKNPPTLHIPSTLFVSNWREFECND